MSYQEKENEKISCNDFSADLLYLEGNDLGVSYTPQSTRFRVWAPTAQEIKLFLYANEDTEFTEGEFVFKKDIKGTFFLEVTGDLAGKYFIYRVDLGDQINQVVDPYTKALSTNSKRGLIVDLSKTNPIGWEFDQNVKLNNYQDAIIYELHIRDFSTSFNSGILNKGKYLAFTETNTTSPDNLKTGIAHLKELGITHVHLQPVFDFATVDETDYDQYNWGYDPYFYNVPEGSYATNPADDTRIREFKQMVKALHDHNIGIIMDVVYNHTYYTKESPFNLLVPNYFYRFDEYGDFANGSGCGNELASERAMVRKFIVDSITYWAKEYHIDGFRFDLMALHDKKTMEVIEKKLHKINPQILIYGEPWTGGLTPLESNKQLTKGGQQGRNIAVFNDNFRNAIKGDSDGIGKGFISGDLNQVQEIKRGIVAGINYSQDIQDFALEPWEVVNYVSSHDNLTLWDKLSKSNDHDSQELRMKMDKMAQAIILTAQGIPFILAGEEFLRSKKANHNSYNAGDEINRLEWKRKFKYLDTFKYYQGLIKLRKRHPAFRLRNKEQIVNHLVFLDSPLKTVAFMLKDYANNDSWENIIVIHNPRSETILFQLPFLATWEIVVNEQNAGIETLQTFSDLKIEVKPVSTMVIHN